MDSTWFAVDEDGEVAFFDAGEGGAVPVDGFPMGGEAGGYGGNALEEAEMLALALWARAESDARLKQLLPETLKALTTWVESTSEVELVGPLLRGVGVWTYLNDDPVAVPYVREGTVPKPIKLADLDPRTRKLFRNAKLPLRFASSELVAPGEHVTVAAWDPVWVDTEGRHHPVEGMEDEFEEVRAQFDEMLADEYLPSGAEPGDAPAGEDFYAAVEKVLDNRWEGDFESRMLEKSPGCLGAIWLILRS